MVYSENVFLSHFCYSHSILAQFTGTLHFLCAVKGAILAEMSLQANFSSQSG